MKWRNVELFNSFSYRKQNRWKITTITFIRTSALRISRERKKNDDFLQFNIFIGIARFSNFKSQNFRQIHNNLFVMAQRTKLRKLSEIQNT